MNIRYITEEEVASLFQERPSDSHKGNFGYVALIGGSTEYSGAIRLAALANAAMRSGAGVATVAAPRGICPWIAPQILEATLLPLSDKAGELVFKESEFERICNRYDCIAIGMGIGNSEETKKAVEYLLRNYDKKLIIDADGINAMSELDFGIIKSTKAEVLLTPHLKEFSRLTGVKGLPSDWRARISNNRQDSPTCQMTCQDLPMSKSAEPITISEIKEKPAEYAQRLAGALGATILLKGPTTYVAGPVSEQVLATDRGCAGMATAGSGDVLSGILSAICPNTGDMKLAAVAGAYINGAAGELAQSRRSDVTMTSHDTAMCIAEIIEGIKLNYRRKI